MGRGAWRTAQTGMGHGAWLMGHSAWGIEHNNKSQILASPFA